MARATSTAEQAPLLQNENAIEQQNTTINSPGDDVSPQKGLPSKASIIGILSTLMLGVFVASVDHSIVIGTISQISSEFQSLSSASWLLTSFSLAQCAFQPMYGKFSDIFGRKVMLIFSYMLFLVGCLICGIGVDFWHILAGRAISGIGSGGMIGLVSVVVADLLPIHEVAAWRSYVNVAATVGRSSGGPIGGWLIDHVGWRWIFLAQCPLAALTSILVWWRLPNLSVEEPEPGKEKSFKAQISRIDVLGSVLLASTLVSLFLSFDLVSKFAAWYITAPLGVTFVILAVALYYVERHVAKEPVFPIDLLTRRDVLTADSVSCLQSAGQFVNFYSVPIYFQIAGAMTAAAAGARLVLVVGGNMVGGIVAGHIISRTRRYKAVGLAAVILGCTGYTLMLVRLRGSIAWYDTMTVILGGLGLGMTQSSAFIHLTASLEPKDIAIASMSYYLCGSIGPLVSINLVNVLQNVSLPLFLKEKLQGVQDSEKIIKAVISDFNYINTLPRALRELVSSAYINSLSINNALSLTFGFAALIAALTIREHPLGK